LRTPSFGSEEKKAEESALLLLEFIGLSGQEKFLAKNCPMVTSSG